MPIVIAPAGAHGFDSSWAHPSAAALAAAGGQWRAGYVSNDATKDLSDAEIADAAAHQLGAELVLEFGAGWWRGPSPDDVFRTPHDAGFRAAQFAAARAAAQGFPPGATIRYTVDQGVSANDLLLVDAMLDGVAAAGTDYAIGLYGPANVIERAVRSGRVGTTVQWGGDGSYVSPAADILQLLVPRHPVPGTDELVVAAPCGFPVWSPGAPERAWSAAETVAFALSQTGVHEIPDGSNNVWCTRWLDQRLGWVTLHGGRQSMRTGQAWCGSHVRSALELAGAQWGRANLFACAEDIADLQADGRWFSTPEVGDIVFYRIGDGHQGLVAAVNPDGSIETSEGNWLNRVCRFGRADGFGPPAHDPSLILGFGRPTYGPAGPKESDMADDILFRADNDPTFQTYVLVSTPTGPVKSKVVGYGQPDGGEFDIRRAHRNLLGQPGDPPVAVVPATWVAHIPDAAPEVEPTVDVAGIVAHLIAIEQAVAQLHNAAPAAGSVDLSPVLAELAALKAAVDRPRSVTLVAS